MIMITLRNCGIRNVIRLKCGRHLCQQYSPRVLLKRCYQDDAKETPKGTGKQEIPSAISLKYQVFRDDDATVILDVEEERLKQLETLDLPHRQFKDDEFSGLNLERGVRGVFDIEEIVDVLRREKLEDICVVSLPADTKYVDHIVVVTGKSKRHMTAVAEFIRKLYKRKRHPHDVIPRIEGEMSSDWMALDLGNIALHIFSRRARPIYDVESLWSLGSEYDLNYNKPDDPLITLLEQHSVYLGGLKPADGIIENTNG